MALPYLNGLNLPNIGGSSAVLQNRATIKIRNTTTGEMRRVSLPNWPTLPGLDQLLESIFGQGLPRPYFIQYVDNEGDNVSITSSLELDEAIEQAKESGTKVLSLKVGRPKTADLPGGGAGSNLRSSLTSSGFAVASGSGRASLLSSNLALERLTISTPAAAALPVPDHFADKVRQLLAAGYVDVAQDIALLIKHGLDVEMALEDLRESGVAAQTPPADPSAVNIEFPPRFIELVHELVAMGFSDLTLNVEALLSNGAILTEAALALVAFAQPNVSEPGSSSSSSSSANTTNPTDNTGPTESPAEPASTSPDPADFTLPDFLRQAVLNLENMGFGDRLHVIEVLVKYGGNEQEAALELAREDAERQLLKEAEERKEAERKAKAEAERKAKEEETIASIQLPEKFKRAIVELSFMGFEDVVLNTELLIKNAGDLQLTLADLLKTRE